MTTLVRRTWIACVVSAAIVLVGADQARADWYPIADGVYGVRHSLDGDRPPAGDVEMLFVSRLGPEDRLDALTRFPHLRDLDLSLVEGVDLAPLASLRLNSLALNYVRHTDLAPLGAMQGLRRLTAFDLRDVQVPPRLTLPASLRALYVVNDGFHETGAPVQAMIEATDWTALARLQWLDLGVGGNESMEPIEVDLGFLRGLSGLRLLEIQHGVHHRGPQTSPLAAPFDGLPAGLRDIRIDSRHPGKTRRALERRFPRAIVHVFRRYPYDPGRRSFTIDPPTRCCPEWGTYGSFWEAFDGRYGETEYEALTAARRILRREAPRLLRRLDFDPEAGGTGVTARRRSHLERMLRILGIQP
jgi:hypothetical protein